MSKPLSSRHNQSPACCLLPFFTVFGIIGVISAIESASLFPLLFAAIGAGGIYWQVAALRAQKNNLPQKQSDWQPKPIATAPAGVGVVLKPVATRVGSCIGMAIFAAFWNSFIIFFLWKLLTEGKSFGLSQVLGLLFVIPFALIGVVLLWAAAGKFLQLFNAGLQLTLNRGELAPGEEAELCWQMKGGWLAPQNLNITLEAREEATYRRGTDTITEKSIFHQNEVARVSGQSEMQNGRAPLAIPLHTMHSFEAANNKIIWSLKLRGDIARWPDIEEEYVLLVAPQSNAAGGAS